MTYPEERLAPVTYLPGARPPVPGTLMLSLAL